MGLCNFSARTRGFLQGERPAWLERSGWRTAPTSLARGGESAVNPGSASGPGAPGQRAVGVTGGRAGRGAAQELLTPADTHSHHQRLSGTPGPTGTQRPVRVVPHLSLHVVPGLLQIVPGAVREGTNSGTPADSRRTLAPHSTQDSLTQAAAVPGVLSSFWESFRKVPGAL